MINFNMMVGYICYLIREEIDDHVLTDYVRSLSAMAQERIRVAVSRIYGKSEDSSTPLTMSIYMAMKAKMKNTFEMLWPVKLDIEHRGRLLSIRYIVSAQPDPKHEGWWYLRLPDWSVLRFKPDMELHPMHNLTCKTHMKEFFTIQRKLLREQRRWSPDMDTYTAWQQVMVQSELMGDGSYVSYSHEAFDAHQKGLYHLEDKRTRRIDYEWGTAGDPMDKHEKGKKTKALMAGHIPCDLGKVSIGGVRFSIDMLKGKSMSESKDVRNWFNKKSLFYFFRELEQMVRWNEMPMDRVAHPANFSVAKKLSQLFEGCYMPSEVGEKFAKRLGNNPYWKVKDKKRQRWYIYSYDWRIDRRTFAHSVIPIGHIEPYRKIPGEYYFTMYAEATLAERRNQSLWIADYAVVLDKELIWQLGLKPFNEETGEYTHGKVLRVSAYNDWAAQLWRELGTPATPPLSFEAAEHAAAHQSSPQLSREQPAFA